MWYTQNCYCIDVIIIMINIMIQISYIPSNTRIKSPKCVKKKKNITGGD